MNKIFLITRPNYDIATHYLFAWSGIIIKLAREKNIQVLDLRKEKANKKELESRLNKMKPGLVIFNGHGSADSIAGHDDKILIKAGDNEFLLKSKIIYAISCRSADKLGPKSIRSGAFAYIGYVQDFIFCSDNHKIARPLTDKIAKWFLEPSNQVAISLLKANTAGKSSLNSKKFFARNIQKLLSSKNLPEFTQYAKYLWWDMKHQVCLGNKKVAFCPNL